MRLSLKLATLLLAAIACTGQPGAAGAETLVKHAKGETVLPSVPERVFVYDLASLDTLSALGVEVAGVPGGVKPDYLQKYNAPEVAKIGSVFEPDFEKVSAAAPDLIIVGGRSSAKYADLAKIAPTIDLTPDFTNFVGSAKTNIETLGSIFGKDAEARRLIDKLDASIADLKGKAGKAGKGMLLLTTGGKLSTFGPGSRFGILFSEYGVEPVDTGLKVGMHGQPASFEYILDKNPDWIFIIDRDAAIGHQGGGALKLLDNEIVGKTTAWQKGHVVALDPVSWYLIGGGVTSLQREVDQLIAAFDKG